MLAGGTCRKNRKVFPGKCDFLILPKGCERDDFKRLYNRRFRLVAIRCKYSKTLQFISSLRKLEKIEVTQRRGQELITLQCTTDIT